MRKLLRYGGVVAGVILIVFGTGAISGLALLLAGIGLAVLAILLLKPAEAREPRVKGSTAAVPA